MKNIHLIPTSQPSRLVIDTIENKLSIQDILHEKTINVLPQNIYIASNENPKANVYCLINGVLCKTKLLNGKIVSRQLVGGATMDICKSEYSEIILTTDQDLIKDGVQAVNDEFLEWFMKNPNCEEVKVEKKQHFEPNKTKRENQLNGVYYSYKIIIPKEEQKQHLIDMMRYDEELGLYEEPKQETLEEAAEKFAINIQTKAGTMSRENAIEWFKAGAKYQAETMYSEKDLRDAYNNGMFAVTSGRNFSDWFKNFKKK